MHALTKTKVSEASLTNLHNSQLLRLKAMFWRLGENIDPRYLQMVILSHIAFVCFYSLFNNVMEKVWTKKKRKKKARDRKRKFSPSSGGKFAY